MSESESDALPLGDIPIFVYYTIIFTIFQYKIYINNVLKRYEIADIKINII